jgi:hypothetical protein
MTKEEVAKQLKALQEKDRQRVERLQMLKVKTMQVYAKDFPGKPCLRKESQDVWKRHCLNKHLSSSVFQRFEQYEMERKSKLERAEREVRQAVTPFAPRISEQSRLLASRSSSRANLGLSRSCSCKCFKRAREGLGHSTSTAMHSSRRL